MEIKDLVIAGMVGFTAALIDALVRANIRAYRAEEKAIAYETAYAKTNRQPIEFKLDLVKQKS